MKTWLGSSWAVCALAIVLGIFISMSQSAGQVTKGGAASAVERGKYLVSITGCHDCHSPKKDAVPATLTKRGRSAGVPQRLRHLRPLRVKSIPPLISPHGPVRGGR